MKPSAEAVLALLREHPEGATGMDALYAGCGDRLAARIHELKAEGHRFAETWETTPNGARIKRWRLIPPVVAAPIRGSQQHMFGLDSHPGAATPLRGARMGA